MRLFLGRVETLIISYLILYFSKLSSFFTLFEWKSFYKVLYLTLYTEQIIVGGHPWSNSRREIISAGMNFFGPLRITHLESSCDGDFHDHTSSMRSRPPEVILSSDFGSKGQISSFFLVIFHGWSCSMTHDSWFQAEMISWRSCTMLMLHWFHDSCCTIQWFWHFKCLHYQEDRDYVISIVFQKKSEKYLKNGTDNSSFPIWQIIGLIPPCQDFQFFLYFSEYFWTINYRDHIVPAL